MPPRWRWCWPRWAHVETTLPATTSIQDVARFEDCQAIAVERNCSDLLVYSNKNKRCLVQDCGDCNGAIPTATVLPTVVPTAVP